MKYIIYNEDVRNGLRDVYFALKEKYNTEAIKTGGWFIEEVMVTGFNASEMKQISDIVKPYLVEV